MRDVRDQDYCVGCESWIFDNKSKTKKENFTQLVSLQGRQDIKLKNKNTEIKVRESQLIYFDFSHNVRIILEKKLVYLTNLLERETDLNKIK